MKKQMVKNYYISRKPKLLKSFDKTAGLLRDSIVSRYGADFADTLYREVRQEYEALIPQIPHIEGIRAAPLNTFLVISAQELAVYKAMKKEGKTAGETWEESINGLGIRESDLQFVQFFDILFSGRHILLFDRVCCF